MSAGSKILLRPPSVPPVKLSFIPLPPIRSTNVGDAKNNSNAHYANRHNPPSEKDRAANQPLSQDESAEQAGAARTSERTPNFFQRLPSVVASSPMIQRVTQKLQDAGIGSPGRSIRREASDISTGAPPSGVTSLGASPVQSAIPSPPGAPALRQASPPTGAGGFRSAAKSTFGTVLASPRISLRAPAFFRNRKVVDRRPSLPPPRQPDGWAEASTTFCGRQPAASTPSTDLRETRGIVELVCAPGLAEAAFAVVHRERPVTFPDYPWMPIKTRVGTLFVENLDRR